MMSSRLVTLLIFIPLLVISVPAVTEENIDTLFYDEWITHWAMKGLGEGWYLFETCMARSKDLAAWEESPLNPILSPSADDRNVAGEIFTAEERHLIATSVNINNSDVDYCEFEGKTLIYYTWCDQGQHGGKTTFLAHAVYNGPIREWHESYFPG